MKTITVGKNHTIRLETTFMGQKKIFYDGTCMTEGGNGFSGSNFIFTVLEDGENVHYEISTRVSLGWDPHITVRRNGLAIYSD